MFFAKFAKIYAFLLVPDTAESSCALIIFSAKTLYDNVITKVNLTVCYMF